MKRLLLFLCCVAGALTTASAQSIKFEISDGTDNPILKQRIEQNVSALLTEAKRAYENNAQINFSSLSITPDAKNSISMLWSNVNFNPTDSEIVERLLTVAGGFQVRNIPLETRPMEASMQDDNYQEAVIDFDHSGQITSFYFAISTNLYAQVIEKRDDVTDTRRRQLILDYVEHFRTAYNQKDINFLEAVFSEDAIIITGKVIQRKQMDSPISTTRVEYKVQDKKQYLTRLRSIFATAKYVRVNFSEIKVMRHPTLADYYGVLLRQGYSTNTYSDDGYVFLLWDFVDEQHPQIHVRTWQPYWMDEAKTVAISDEEVFDIGDFNIDF